MSISEMPIAQMAAYKLANPNCVFTLDGNKATAYTGSDVPNDLRRARQTSVQDFRDRFTDSETALFLDKVKTDDNVNKLNFKLSTAEEPLDLDSITLQQGMHYLVSVGVITEARRIEILE